MNKFANFMADLQRLVDDHKECQYGPIADRESCTFYVEVSDLIEGYKIV